jgi:hypothetical protein
MLNNQLITRVRLITVHNLRLNILKPCEVPNSEVWILWMACTRHVKPFAPKTLVQANES